MSEGAGVALVFVVLLGVPFGLGFLLGRWRGRRAVEPLPASSPGPPSSPSGVEWAPVPASVVWRSSPHGPETRRRLGAKHPLDFYKNRHVSDYGEDVQTLKRAGKFKETERLLVRLIDVVEAAAAVERCADPDRPHAVIPPGGYLDLAIVRRKLHDAAGERAVIERYIKLTPAASEWENFKRRLTWLDRKAKAAG